jgi:hypothetical protein
MCCVLLFVPQVQLLQQERSSEASAANPDQEAALEAAIRAETDFLMQVCTGAGDNMCAHTAGLTKQHLNSLHVASVRKMAISCV